MVKNKMPGGLAFNPLKLPRMVLNPFRNRVQFVVERLLLSGTVARLSVAAAVIGMVAVGMGLLGFIVAANTDQAFGNPAEAVWWAFLRLSDPGYLGDDEGMGLRTVSTVVTVAGCVLFFGVLVAILTQGLNEWIRGLEMGLTPISARNHVIILGWSSRLPGLVRNMLESEQSLLLFLQRVGARRLKLVLLVEELSPTLTQEFWGRVGNDRKGSRVIMRSGSPLRLDHLNRVDYLRASAIVLPAEHRRTQDGASLSDNTALKTILSISNSLRFAASALPLPLLVAELFDSRKLPIALSSYRGPIEVVAGDEVMSRMIAQMVRHPQIGDIYRELLTRDLGNELLVRKCPPEWVGRSFWAVAEERQRAVLMGVVQAANGKVDLHLNPDPGHVLGEQDKLIFLARERDDLLPQLPAGAAKDGERWPRPAASLAMIERPGLRILIVGWSRRIPALLQELESYVNQPFDITVASRLRQDARDWQLLSYGGELKRLKVTHIVGDCTVPDQMLALAPETFDVVLCLASDLPETDEESDARTLVAYAILIKSLRALPPSAKTPRVVLELLDELNVALIDPERCEYLLSPQVLSHMLAQVALRREMNAVYEELFNSGETEISFRNPLRYGVTLGQTLTFAELEVMARRHHDVALGYLKACERGTATGGGVHLNPDRAESWVMEAGDQFIVLRN